MMGSAELRLRIRALEARMAEAEALEARAKEKAAESARRAEAAQKEQAAWDRRFERWAKEYGD